jgi:hypothetical protein
MSKKIMVLALAVVSAVFFALPAMASATEIHWSSTEKFTIAGPGGELRASGEPTITCTATSGNGTFASTTTGSTNLTFTGCHTAVFGLTASCKSEGNETAGTITTSGTFHLIRLSTTTAEPAILLTTETTKIVCAGISTITTHDNVIGRIISPECGKSSKTLTVLFAASGSTQSQLTWTGKNYDLIATTNDGVIHTAALVGEATNTQSTAGTLDCT